MVHKGSWKFILGHDGGDGAVILHPGDTISLPLHMFRGFEAVSDDENFLFAILGGDDPGRVTWAPYVFERAKGHGLVLTESGRLVDTTVGEAIPQGDAPMPPTTMEDVAKLDRYSPEQMAPFVVEAGTIEPDDGSDVAAHSRGVTEAPILGPASAHEGLGPARVPHAHGFHFRRWTLRAGANIPTHTRSEDEVVFVQAGKLVLTCDEHEVVMGEGDTISIPATTDRSWNVGPDPDNGATLFIVRPGDEPSAANWA